MLLLPLIFIQSGPSFKRLSNLPQVIQSPASLPPKTKNLVQNTGDLTSNPLSGQGLLLTDPLFLTSGNEWLFIRTEHSFPA